MNILLLGSGGREHAIAVKMSQSPLCDQLFIAPGNAGTTLTGTNVSMNILDFASIEKFVLENNIHLVVVGPEEPLVKGIVDYFKTTTTLQKVLIIGPSLEGAKLEGSKDYAKAFMQRNSIPTAAFKTFSRNEIHEAENFLKTLKPPYVLKADGLAAGKGVVIPQTLEDAIQALKEILGTSKFGTAGDKIVIEEFLSGIELSVFVLTDGKDYIILPEAKDYKRIGDNDTGPNTGGMGAVSPVPFAGKEFFKKVEEQIIIPTVDGLKRESIDYCGFIFIGLMNVKGNPFVIEYNVRMGDPETEVVFPRIDSDVVELFVKAAKGELKNTVVQINPQTALTVVMVSGGYPGDFEKGKEIVFKNKLEGSLVYHAGTKEHAGRIVTNGGRVLAVTSFGKNIQEARKKSYDQIDEIKFENAFFRKDIGLDLL
jgi:phosphoribosylamine--glycine ligase